MRKFTGTCVLVALLLSLTSALLSDDGLVSESAERELDFRNLSKLSYSEPMGTSAVSVPGLGNALSFLVLSDSDDPPSYSRFRLGPYWHTDDLSGMGAGVFGGIVFGHYLIGRLLALESELGVFYSEGTVDGVDTDVLGAPLFLNARVTLPIAFLEAHGGVGIGGAYGNVLRRPEGASSNREEEFIFAGNLFLGLAVDLGPLGIGVEGKYIVTDKGGDLGTDLDAAVLLASLSIGF